MKEESDKSIELYAKAMLFDHIQRYGSLSSDVGSVLHLLEKIMAEKAVQDKEYDSDFFRCQAVWLKRRADGLAIYDVMDEIPCDVVTIANGMAASMGSFLLAAGAKGKRYVTPSTEVMIHQPLGGVQGQATDISLVADHIQKIKTKLAMIMAKNCGKELVEIINDMERDHWMTGDQAKAYGIADHVGFPEIV